MPKKSEWPAGVEIQKTSLALPRRIWESAKIGAMKENRTLQELVAEALEEYLRKAKKEEPFSDDGPKKGGDRL